jgi:hypothetical protein
VKLIEPGTVRAETENAVPVRCWQRPHQQKAAPISGSSIVNLTAPHMHSPSSGAMPLGPSEIFEFSIEQA